MKNVLLIILGKLINRVSKITNIGSGSTWPGHIALSANKKFIRDVIHKNPQLKTILVVGTNGKTTTASMLATILKQNGKRVVQNNAGANLLNGVASTFLLSSSFSGKLKADYAIFEIDENMLPLVLEELTPFAVVVLNLYRDQLDRYGELDSIAKKWHEAFKKLSKEVYIFLNADDPLIAFLGEDITAQVFYFGVEKEDMKHTSLELSADSTFCPNCHSRLIYSAISYSHLGNWFCPNCKRKHPKIESVRTIFPLVGLYNKYNTIAAVLVAKKVGIIPQAIEKVLKEFTPAFGRQEKVMYKGKQVQIFLSKNPTSFNQSLETITNLYSSSEQSESRSYKDGSSRQARTITGPTILLVLNDRIPDGRDVSWIWDINLESFVDKFASIVVSGDRVYDMGLRVQYSEKSEILSSKSETNTKYKIQNTKYIIEPNLSSAIEKAAENLEGHQTLYILATYSAMLEVRKILTGRKIL